MARFAGQDLMAEGKLSNRFVGRMAGVIWTLSSLLIVIAELLVPPTGPGGHPGTWVVGGTSVLFGVAVWLAPWDRWPRWPLLGMVPLAFATIALEIRVGNGNGFVYSISFLMVFVWLGMGFPRGTSLWFAPLFIVAYAAPLMGGTSRQSELGLSAALVVVPCCLLVGEAVAWGMALLVESEAALVESRERYAGSFEEAPVGMGLATPEGLMLRVNQAFAAILGYRPEELKSRHLRDLTHPDDWEENWRCYADLVAGKIDRYSLEKRYFRSDGSVVWVSATASCARDRDGRAQYVIAQIEDVTERRELREQLAHTAVHDQLTGLPNRLMFMDRLERSLQEASVTGRLVALMFLDLDRFKLINDGLGHDAGDRLLQRVSQRLQRALRSKDLLARFGGDEFTVLCEVDSEEEALEIAERLNVAMDRPLADSDNEQFVSLSIGIALSGPDTTLASSLLRQADVAMYRAKALGPARIAVYREDDDANSVASLRTSNELHRALERGEFELHYQPFVELHSLTLVGLEALVRWRHPTRGLLPPGEFIALAEDCGLIVPLGTWVLREACRQAAAWTVERDGTDQDRDRMYLSVNVSVLQLADPAFLRVLTAALEDSGFAADHLWLEITEGAILQDPEATVATLARIRQIGAHISIDDFGTGYSSLSYLKQLPVEILKIDRSFVDHLDEDADDRAIVRAVIALGESLGLAVIAEGIERPSQAEQLTSLGCHLAQGFLYGRPLSPDRIGRYPRDDLAGWEVAADLTTA
jgi:diguanylate cyclase (GGDEF)-like protein/PAS domain S-box-containing protein